MNTRNIPSIFLAAALFSGIPAQAQQPPAETEYEARLTEAKGEVTVFAAEEPEGVPGARDMPLSAGDKVKTGEDSSAEITFSGEHCVCLRSRSELTLTGLQRADSELSLALGGLLARVQALAGGGFRVRTPAAVASVRGTEFGVEVDGEETHVGVFDEGKVTVAVQDGQPELLKANQETSVRRGGRPAAAYQLRRFVRHRRFMRSFRKRAHLVRKNWRALALAQRQQKRREVLQGLRQQRQQRLRNLQKARPHPRRNLQHAQQEKDKLDRIKRAIRERRRGQGH